MVATRKVDSTASTSSHEPVQEASEKAIDTSMKVVAGKVLPVGSSKTRNSRAEISITTPIKVRFDVSIQEIMGNGGLRPSLHNEVEDLIKLISSMERGSPEVMILKQGKWRKLKSHNWRYVLTKIKKGGNVYSASRKRIYGSRILSEQDRALLKEKNIVAEEVTLNKKEWKIVARTLAMMFHKAPQLENEKSNEPVVEDSPKVSRHSGVHVKEARVRRERSEEKVPQGPEYVKVLKKNEERLLGIAKEQDQKELYRKKKREIIAHQKQDAIQHVEMNRDERKKHHRVKTSDRHHIKGH